MKAYFISMVINRVRHCWRGRSVSVQQNRETRINFDKGTKQFNLRSGAFQQVVLEQLEN